MDPLSNRFKEDAVRDKTPLVSSKAGKPRKQTVADQNVTKAISPIFRQIIEDINKNKENLNLKNYRAAIQTVKGIEILLTKQHELSRNTLTKDVHELTGMSIHAAENYPTIDRFIEGIHVAFDTLQKAYGNAKTDSDKLRLIRHGLDSGGCFESRVEDLYTYQNEIETLKGLLKFEIMELNIQNKMPKYEAVKLNDLIIFLKNKKFFEIHQIDEASFKAHPVIAELQDIDLVELDKPKDPLIVIRDAFSTYGDYGSGEKNFINFLLQKDEFKGYSENQLKPLISEYFEKNPERKGWL